MNKTGLITIVVIVVIIIIGVALFANTSDTTPTTGSEELGGASQVPAQTPETNDTPGVSVGATTSVSVGGAVKSFTVTGDNFKFDQKQMTVKKGDTVKVTFVNGSGFHDWVLPDFNAKTKQLQTGQQETVTFVADKAGSFEYYCSVGNHRAMGMKGTLTVTE
jgi:plastocyanin